MVAMRTWWSAATVFVVVAVSGCGTKVQYSETNAPPRPMFPRSVTEVAVFSSGLPDRPYVEVGMLFARKREYSADEMPDILNALRKEAGKRGCDGIVVTGDNSVVVGGQYSTGTLEGIKAACIVWKEDQPPSAQDAKPEKADANPNERPRPPGAAGFVYGEMLEKSQRTCTEASLEWNPVKQTTYSCSGTPAGVGITARSEVRFCDGRLCEIKILSDSKLPSASWKDVYVQARDALSGKYKQAQETSEDVPDECTTETLDACLADERAKLHSSWWWDSGERIELGITPTGEGKAILEIVYTKWPLDPPPKVGGAGL